MSDSPAMISAPRLCTTCGAEIPSDAPEGGCPGCLLHVGLLPDAQVTARDASAVISTKANECGSAEGFEVNTAGPAGNSEKAKQLRRTECGMRPNAISYAKFYSRSHDPLISRKAVAQVAPEQGCYYH